jgi:hypothetical protein
MSSNADKLVADYLRRLNAALHGLPRARRRELIQEISEHIAAARAAAATDDEASIRTLLDDLGNPEDIAVEAREREGLKPQGRWLDVAALVLLLVGGVVLPVVGWVIGMVLLWVSETWTTREKLVGTLVVPGGLAPASFLGVFGAYTESCGGPVGGPVTCTGGPSQLEQVVGAIIVIILVIAPLLTTAFLARRRAGRRFVSAAV